MKFITDFCLYFAVYTTFWVVTLVFVSKYPKVMEKYRQTNIAGK